MANSILNFGSHYVGGTNIARVQVPGAAAGTADVASLLRAEADIVVEAVYWIPSAAVTGAATNNFAVGVVNQGADGTGTTAVTTVKTYASGTNSVEGVAEALTLSTTEANLEVDAGESLTFDKTENGTGLAQPDGVVEVHYTYRDPA